MTNDVHRGYAKAVSARPHLAPALADLFDHLLVAVIRSSDASRAARLMEGILAGGFRAVEVTATTPGAFDLVRRFARPGLLLGIGTVTSAEHVDRAADAKATFVVSPHTDPNLVARARSSGLVAIPGAMTPTEILRAHAAGADTVKVFPVSAVGGPRFVRWVRGPLPDVPLWVSGDVALDEIPAYVDAGAALIGLTSALTANVGPDIIAAARARAEAALEARDRSRTKAPLLAVVTPRGRMDVHLDDIRNLPPESFCALEAVVAGRRGEAVRVRPLLAVNGMPGDGSARLTSTDGFSREVSVSELMTRGYLHFATGGVPLSNTEGGPLRLYIAGPGDQCDNVKGLRRIELLP